MTGKSHACHELVDFMERRKVNVLVCRRQSAWKVEKACETGNGFKLFYCGSNSRCNGVGVILDDTLKKNVMAVGRRSD